MRIATFNVSGINARPSGLLQWLEEDAPDVACLQELRAPEERFPAAAIACQGQALPNQTSLFPHGQSG